MRRFADLHLRVPSKDLPQAEMMIKKASELGYSLVGIPIPAHCHARTDQQTKTSLQ